VTTVAIGAHDDLDAAGWMDPLAKTAPEVPCRSEDADLWFAERPDDLARAKALCLQCPARLACLAGALERRESWGVWGGEIFVDGAIVAYKRGRGRPRRTDNPQAA
jgi:WhiB family transcriptional regulator, redox-sensing transcriptional regulator